MQQAKEEVGGWAATRADKAIEGVREGGGYGGGPFQLIDSRQAASNVIHFRNKQWVCEMLK